jgi:hypothetical protein
MIFLCYFWVQLTAQEPAEKFEKLTYKIILWFLVKPQKSAFSSFIRPTLLKNRLAVFEGPCFLVSLTAPEQVLKSLVVWHLS